MQPNDILYCEKKQIRLKRYFKRYQKCLRSTLKKKTTEGPASKTAGPTKDHDRGVVNVVYEKKLLEVTG